MVAEVSMGLLDRRLYHIADAAELLEIPGSTLRYWLQGLIRGEKVYLPALRRELNSDQSVTWGEFIESSLLKQLRARGVKLDQIRQFTRAVRLGLGWAYPLARHDVFVGGNGNLIYEAQQLAGLPDEARLLVAGDGYGHGQALLQGLALEDFLEPIRFEHAVPVAWRPDSEVELVTCDPLRRFGAPHVAGVPTSALWELRVAGESVEGIARDFNLSREQVMAAVSYEERHAPTSRAA